MPIAEFYKDMPKGPDLWWERFTWPLYFAKFGLSGIQGKI